MIIQYFFRNLQFLRAAIFEKNEVNNSFEIYKCWEIDNRQTYPTKSLVSPFFVQSYYSIFQIPNIFLAAALHFWDTPEYSIFQNLNSFVVMSFLNPNWLESWNIPEIFYTQKKITFVFQYLNALIQMTPYVGQIERNIEMPALLNVKT